MQKTLSIILILIFFSCSSENEYPTPELSEIYFQDREVETVFINKSDGINIIFLGDGYIQKDLEKARGPYRRDAIKHINYIFNNPPFSEYKEYFNAYIIYAESKDEGPSYDPRTKSTALGVIQGDINPDRYDGIKLNSYIQLVTPGFEDFSENHIILIAIKNGKGGIYAGSSLFANYNESTMLHEVGHHFSLGDEYEQHPIYPEYVDDTRDIPNLDSIGDITQVKWKHFIGLKNYELVGTYEGGGYTKKGIWRPQENSIMRHSRVYPPFFNAPSREAIVKKILKLNDVEYSFEEFLAKDKIALDTINARLLYFKNH